MSNNSSAAPNSPKPGQALAIPATDWRSKLKSPVNRTLTVGENGLLHLHTKKIVYLLLDVSGSMEGANLRHAKSGAEKFAGEALNKGYQVGVIEFGSDASIVCTATSEFNMIRHGLDKLEISGSTNMAAGILLARKTLEGCRGERVMCLVTDGAPDCEKNALDEANAAMDEGMKIMTIGTEDANHAFLKKISTSDQLSSSVKVTGLALGMVDMAKRLPG